MIFTFEVVSRDLSPSSSTERSSAVFPSFPRKIAKSSPWNFSSHDPQIETNRVRRRGARLTFFDRPPDSRVSTMSNARIYRRIDPDVSRIGTRDTSSWRTGFSRRLLMSIRRHNVGTTARVRGGWLRASPSREVPRRDKSLASPTSTFPSARLYPEQTRGQMINAFGSLTPCSPKIRAVSRGRCALGVNALANDSGCAGNNTRTSQPRQRAHMTSRDNNFGRAEVRDW